MTQGDPANLPSPGRSALDRRERRHREHRRLRLRRHGRRAYIRSVYFLPSLATLGNAICGFGAIYVAGLHGSSIDARDPITIWSAGHAFVMAAYLIFVAMIFDALDGRLARFARHTTDFGGQLDSLADVISFGAAPAYLALQVMKHNLPDLPLFTSRLFWAIGALYMACAAMRLARFNVSNEHGEQHHFSFLGLPSPGAAGAVASAVLLQQEFRPPAGEFNLFFYCATWALAPIVLIAGLMMVSNIRYSHLVNRYLRGRRPIGVLVVAVAVLLALVVAHVYTLAATTLTYMLSGLILAAFRRLRPKPPVAVG